MLRKTAIEIRIAGILAALSVVLLTGCADQVTMPPDTEPSNSVVDQGGPNYRIKDPGVPVEAR